MHLKTIKLAGFKSFVDPTIVLLKSQLTAIVGPNGCGKSNIIDAIRWVIGESSAKQLRGELLTDVIFNGTTHRKPVGQASIELLFDNSDFRTLSGAYAQYKEICIRREINREGQSQFYLNGTRCRRRDITDLFLGTGLGPSSYAIIEQGVISQFIEGKPEDIRVYLEEAAGVSKYRERRRETESRIRSTRENLDRLTDLRNEIAKQLEHLKRQANAAERFKLLKQEQRLLKAQWYALQCRTLEVRMTQEQQLLNQQATQLEAKMAELRRIDRDITQQRETHTACNDALNAVQERYYQLGADTTQQEQHIRHIQERERQITADLGHMQTSWNEAQQNLADDQKHIATLTIELTELEPKATEVAEISAKSHEELHKAEQTQIHWQAQWDDFQAQAWEAEQKAKVEQTRLQHVTQKIQSVRQRIQRLEEQCQQFHTEKYPQEITELSEQAALLKQQLDALQNAVMDLNQQIQRQREENKQAQSKGDDLRQGLNHLLNRQASLEALQQSALGKADSNVHEWLKKRGWDQKTRLLEGLEVEKGWETAVETVLSSYLEAICTDASEDLRIAAESFTQGKLTLVNHTQKSAAQHPSNPNLVFLSSKVRGFGAVNDLLNGVYLAEDIKQAWDIMQSLESHESVVTRAGVWFGSSWVRLSTVSDQTAGILERKQDLQEITLALTQQQERMRSHEFQLRQDQEALAQLEEKRDACQREFREISTQYSDVRAQLGAKQASLEQLMQRESVASQELQEQKQQLAHELEQQDGILISSQHAHTALQTYEEQRTALLQAKEAYATQYQALRLRAERDKQTADACQIQLSSTQNKLHYLHQNIARAQKQLTQLEERRVSLIASKTEITAPLPDLESTLKQTLTRRLEVEKELNSSRETLNHLEHVLRELETQRLGVEGDIEHFRDKTQQTRIQQTTLQTHKENHLLQIQATEFSLETLLQELPQEAEEADWQEQLAQKEAKIQRLGAINLAAIDEYNTLLERKTYLDSQDQDVCEALATLEEAIRKIDKESRARLRETFDCANEHFKKLFTTVFGGGHAELEFTSEEVLNGGVIIRAQPPGKRNTLLHLLSGGEKALTAIALVFSLFQLNPAPFCILDEVDAPLDEANVVRFCRLVTSMSEAVQFIFISHNKVTMEMAKELIGVTMQEPGISRLVSVDIDAAVAMSSPISPLTHAVVGEG